MRRLAGLGDATEFFGSRGYSLTDDLPDSVRTQTKRIFGEDLTATGVAQRIVADVRAEGDVAVRRYTHAIDGEPLAFIEVAAEEIAAARESLDANLLAALKRAADRVKAFQTKAMPRGWFDDERQYGETITPVSTAGVYVPAGTVPLASTVIMTAVPARVAGVDQIVLCTPASGSDLPDPAILAAASIAGVDRIFKIGGAQAIAAMALGTDTVPRADVVCGPGNIFVTAAKKVVYGEVGIDGIFGPTETLVIADHTADPELCAADLLAQAEHDVMAMPVLVTTSHEIADAVEHAIEAQLSGLPRADTARTAVEQNGAAIVVNSVAEGVDVANMMAPEHLCLAVEDPSRYTSKVQSAGGLFLGEYSAEVLGDYIAGPSHVMPTSGTARFASALSVRNFLKVTPLVQLDADRFMEVGEDAALLAHMEGLTAHAGAAEIRTRKLVGE
jgi:histidinol dehydrogenase